MIKLAVNCLCFSTRPFYHFAIDLFSIRQAASNPKLSIERPQKSPQKRAFSFTTKTLR